MPISGWILYTLIFLDLVLLAALVFGLWLIGQRHRKLIEAHAKTAAVRDEYMRRKAELAK